MPLIKDIASAKKKKGVYTITVPVSGTDSGEVNTVEVLITVGEEQPSPTPNPVILNYDSEDSNGDRVFKAEYNYNQDAVGQVYPMRGTMKNTAGTQVGRHNDLEVTIEGASVTTGV